FNVVNAATITAVVGAGAAAGKIIVTAPGGVASITGFTVTPPPVITSFSPSSGPAGSSVTITGTGFNAGIGSNVVYLGGVKATVTAATATSITVTVPTGTAWQPITVTSNNLTAYSALPFVVTFSGATSFNAKAFSPSSIFAS